MRFLPAFDDQARGLRQRLRSSGRCIAVLSGKGGVGKTFVSTSLAVLAAQGGARVVIVDGDLGLANVDVVLRTSCRFTIEDVIAGRCELQDAIGTGAPGVSLVTAASGYGSSNLDAAQQGALAECIAELRQHFDLVVLDCGAGIGPQVLFLAGLAQSRVLVLTPEPTSMVDAYATIKALADEGHDRVDVIVNCTVSDTDGKTTYDRLVAVVARFLSSQATFLGGIPRDDVVRRAVMARRVVVEEEPGSRAARALGRVADELWRSRSLGHADGSRAEGSVR